MNFKSPSAILTEVSQLLLSQNTVAGNRTLINRIFNGDPSSTPEEARAENLKTNFNSLEGTRIASNATNQLNSASLTGARYFTVKLDKGPIFKRGMWGAEISKYINRELKRCRPYRAARESANAQVVLHGPGPMVWRNRRTPVPSVAGIEDVLVPSGTLTDFDNLDYLSIYREMTWSQLENAAFGETADPGWNKGYVKAILATLYKLGLQPIYQGNRWLFPEKLAEDVKEGALNNGNSSLPKLLAWDFFYRNEDTGKWNRRMLLDYANMSPSYGLKESDSIMKEQQFIYEKDDYAESREEIIHWYIGNCSNVAPYRYYSIRSMGYLLYGTVLTMNKMRCRFYDHIFQQLLTWFRNVSEDNREKLQMIDLQNFGVFPEGVSMVTANERHAVDPNIVLLGMNQGRQLMAESAFNFVPNTPDTNSGKTMTAAEYLGRQNETIAMTSAVQGQLREQSNEEYREICRRFCMKSNPDPMAKRFRENIQKAGVPLDMLDCDAWDIVPEQAMGGGNKAVALNTTGVLMQEMLPLVGPDAQRIIMRARWTAVTDNPEEAMEAIPDAPDTSNDDIQYAQVAYSVLMDGVPFIIKEGINHVVYTGTLMQMSQITIQQTAAVMEQPQGSSIAAEKIAGLFNVLNHCAEQVQVIAKAESRREAAKQMFKALNELMAALQDMAKQLMAQEEQKAQQQGQIDPETQAKIQERMMLAETNAQISQAKAAQKQEQLDVKFYSENQRKNAMTAAEIQRKLALTQTDIAATDMLTEAEMLRPEPAGKRDR